MPDATQLAQTRARIDRGIWVCAGLTMAASMLTGWLTFDHFRPGEGVMGLATAIAVDTALWVVLTGDKALGALGLRSTGWGRAMRYATALASATMNCSAALDAHSPPLVALHAILPALLIGLTEYSGSVGVTLTAAAREIELSRVVIDTPAPASHPIAVGPAAPLAELKQVDLKSPSWRRPLHSVSSPTSRPATPNTAPRAQAGKRAPVRERAYQWLDTHPAPHKGLASEMAAELNLKPDTCRRHLRAWLTERQEATA